MKRKPVKIDWDELESAFNNKNEELVYYLDRVTGQVALEGEGEDSFDEDENDLAEVSPVDESIRVVIEPPDTDQLVGWMTDFIGEADGVDAAVAEKLTEALQEDEPVPAVRAVLDAHAETRDRWFMYRSDRLHQLIDAWLDANEIGTTNPPPWRA